MEMFIEFFPLLCCSKLLFLNRCCLVLLLRCGPTAKPQG